LTATLALGRTAALLQNGKKGGLEEEVRVRVILTHHELADR
jgi:hypothetical protein